ncbi:endonuclease/exonuclease/phosphatase family protein [Murinocardiopsis flavida]|nr:endonuclease/exonuclease/phosphatase family protein [Murinocardiopsis flavida]
MNVWGVFGDWEQRRAVLRAGLRRADPDLLTLQETIVTESYDQVRDLLGEEYHIAHQVGRAANGSGASIASRWPLAQVRRLDLDVSPRTADFACTTLLARTPTPAGPVLLVNHFPSWKLDMEAEREAQAVIAARAAQEAAPEGGHVVLAGDLDADPAAASIRFLTGRQSLGGTSVCFRDAWDSANPGEPGHTYTPDNPLMSDGDWPFRRIDYILVRCGEHGGPTLEVRACRRLFAEPVDGVWASDHFGLLADLAAP